MDDSARLIGWKAIGNFLGRDARTARRWEAERGLPVHRVPGGERATVWADRTELGDWMAGIGRQEDLPLDHGPLGWIPRFGWRFVVPGALAALILVGALATLPRDAVLPAYAHDAQSRELYLRARYALDTRTPHGLALAEAQFRRLIAVHPGEVAGHVGLAESYLLLREFGTLPDRLAYPAAEAAAERALAIAADCATARRALAFVRFWWRGDVEAGLADFARAARDDPADARTFHWQANALAARARWREAEAAMERARSLDPASRAVAADAAWLAYLSGAPDGLGQLRRMVDLDPRYAGSRRHLGLALLHHGDGTGSLAQMRAAAQLRNDADRLLVLDRAERAYAAGGLRGMIDVLAAETLREGGSAVEMAEWRALAGDRAAAARWLAAARARREPALVYRPMLVGLRRLAIADPSLVGTFRS